MKLLITSFFRATGALLLALMASAAQAHTGYDTSGLMAGVLHPFGMDHLLAMVAVGVWSVSVLPLRQTWWGPATFMLGLMLSAALGGVGVRVPFLEQLIALSVLMFGGMLMLARWQMPLAAGLGWVALAASLHGLAHGAEAPPTGFAGYAFGFLLTTALLHGAGVIGGLGLRRFFADKANWALVSLGVCFGGAGVYLLGQV